MSDNKTALRFWARAASSVLKSTRAGATVSSSSVPADSAASLAREPFIEIADMPVVHESKHLNSYTLDFTLHCDSLPERHLWKDNPVWPALRSLTLLTAEGYLQHLHAWEKGEHHVTCLKKAKNWANARAGYNSCPKPFENDSVESKTAERFYPHEAFSEQDWKAFVKRRISESDFDTGIVKTVTFRRNLTGSRVEPLGGSSRHGPQQGSSAELEGTSRLVSWFDNNETQRLYLILRKVETRGFRTQASKSLSYSYHFSAQVREPPTRGIVFSIKTDGGPVIDLLDHSKTQDKEA